MIVSSAKKQQLNLVWEIKLLRKLQHALQKDAVNEDEKQSSMRKE